MRAHRELDQLNGDCAKFVGLNGSEAEEYGSLGQDCLKLQNGSVSVGMRIGRRADQSSSQCGDLTRTVPTKDCADPSWGKLGSDTCENFRKLRLYFGLDPHGSHDVKVIQKSKSYY